MYIIMAAMDKGAEWAYQFCIFGIQYTRPLLECGETLICLKSINPNMINHFTGQSQTCKLLKIILNIERKLWKVVQTQVELMRINFKFEAPILQVQLITHIIY